MSDFLQREKTAGQKAARSIRNQLRREIKSDFKKRSGLMAQTGVRSLTKFGQLDRLTITSPKYSFIHHFGYSRKYGNNTVSIAAKEHIGKALDKSKALERLADELGRSKMEILKI
jgi:hypothetical protein